MGDRKLVRTIDNSDGKYTCRECSSPLISVRQYESPKGRVQEIVGVCSNTRCIFSRESQVADR
jgi:hypothetical protein